jgi:membrane protease YdiL (CAAX protease family)
MPTALDLLYVGLLAVVGPAADYLFVWPALKRLFQIDPPKARARLYAMGIVVPWATVALGAAIWMSSGRSWTLMGFTIPDGWRLWTAAAPVVLLAAYLLQGIAAVAREEKIRANVRQQFEKYGDVLPHTSRELWQFGGVSLTAGFCEEFMFRGYFIWTLSAWMEGAGAGSGMAWWVAAGLNILIFAIGHAYQGWGGVMRTGVVGTIFTLVLALTDSLWPPIVLHALVDFGNGVIAWLALRDRTSARMIHG